MSATAAGVFAPQDGVDALLLRRAEYRRTGLFVYQVAPFRLWREWDIPRVAAVDCEGAGGCTAGYVAGVLGPDDAVRLLVPGRRLPEHGGTHAELHLRAGGLDRVARCAPDHEELDAPSPMDGVRRLRQELPGGPQALRARAALTGVPCPGRSGRTNAGRGRFAGRWRKRTDGTWRG